MTAVKTVTSLKSILTTAKTVEADFPGFPGFKVNLSFLPREEAVKIRKKSTATSYKKGRLEEVVNDDLFLQLYTKATVKGWSGLTLEYLERLAPIDVSGMDLTSTLEFSDENALMLMQSSSDFDSFVSDTATELANFPKASGK